MKTTYYKFLILFFLTLMLNMTGHAQMDLSISRISQNHIIDTTATLLPNEIQTLIQQQEQLKRKTNIDLKIVLIPNTQHISLDRYGHQLFNVLQQNTNINPKNILLVIAMSEKKLYAEVSPLLSQNITQTQIDQIIADSLLPKFQSGLFYEGLSQIQLTIMQQEQAVFNQTYSNFHKFMNPTFIIYLLISFLSSAALFWLFRLIILKFGYSIGLAFYSANLIFLIFTHVFMFNYSAFFWLSLSSMIIPSFYYLMSFHHKNYDSLTMFLYSLPFYMFAFYGFSISLFFKIFPILSLIMLCIALLMFSVMSIYLIVCYFCHCDDGPNFSITKQRSKLSEKIYRTLHS